MATQDPSNDDLQQDSGSLVPAITTILAAIAAYAATHKTIGTSVETVDKALGLSAIISGALLQVALRSVASQIKNAKSKDEKFAFSDASDSAVQQAVADGMTTLAMAARGIVNKRMDVLGPKAKLAVSPAGESYTPAEDLVPGDTDNPQVLARRVAQTVRNSAVQNLAQQAQQTSDAASPNGVYRKTWHCMHDARTRATHAFLGSPSYEYHTVDLDKPFVTIEGNELMFPGDPAAPIEETAHCRCHITTALHIQKA